MVSRSTPLPWGACYHLKNIISLHACECLWSEFSWYLSSSILYVTKLEWSRCHCRITFHFNLTALPKRTESSSPVQARHACSRFQATTNKQSRMRSERKSSSKAPTFSLLQCSRMLLWWLGRQLNTNGEWSSSTSFSITISFIKLTKRTGHQHLTHRWSN
jgi:hypothetical protein